MSTIEKAAARLVKQKQCPADGGVPAQMNAEATHSAALDEATASAALPATGVRPIRVERYCEFNLPWLAENGFIVPGHENLRTQQELRRIKRPLLTNVRAAAAQKYALPANIFICN